MRRSDFDDAVDELGGDADDGLPVAVEEVIRAIDLMPVGLDDEGARLGQAGIEGEVNAEDFHTSIRRWLDPRR